MLGVRSSARKLLGVSLFLFVLDRFWGFVYTNTIYANPKMEYATVLIFLFLFSYIALNCNFGNKTRLSIVWMPYIILTFLGYALRPAILAPYWLICLIMLLVATRIPLNKEVPFRLLSWGALFALAGIFVQIFLPSFYSSNVAILFLDDKTEMWGEKFGFNGFTYQLGVTASILIYGEVALLYMKDAILPKRLNKPVVYYFLVILLIIGVFLSGKRLLAALALLLPFIVYFLTKRFSANKLVAVAIVGVLGFFAFEYFVANIQQFSDSFIFRRFASSYIDSKMGNDITSNRTFLYELAWKAFYDHPFLGIGVGQFGTYTGAPTQVHNTYLQVLCEQGVVGFVIFVYPILFCFIHTLRLVRRIKGGVYFNYVMVSLAFQLIYIIYSMTGNENIGSGYIMYFMGIAIIISVEKQIQLSSSKARN